MKFVSYHACLPLGFLTKLSRFLTAAQIPYENMRALFGNVYHHFAQSIYYYNVFTHALTANRQIFRHLFNLYVKVLSEERLYDIHRCELKYIESI